jgi:hypothetical protein
VRPLVHDRQQHLLWAVLLIGVVSPLSSAQGAGQPSQSAPITVSNRSMRARQKGFTVEPLPATPGSADSNLLEKQASLGRPGC